MATVFLAHDQILGRDVALKVPREQYAEDGELVERFRREASNVVKTNLTLEARLPERQGRR